MIESKINRAIKTKRDNLDKKWVKWVLVETISLIVNVVLMFWFYTGNIQYSCAMRELYIMRAW